MTSGIIHFLALEQEALLPPVDQKRCIFFWDTLLSTKLSGYAFFLSVFFFSSVTQFIFIPIKPLTLLYLEEAFSKGFSFKGFLE